MQGDLAWLLDEETVESALEEGGSPATRFAETIGLTNCEWLSGGYLMNDGGPEPGVALAVGL